MKLTSNIRCGWDSLVPYVIHSDSENGYDYPEKEKDGYKFKNLISLQKRIRIVEKILCKEER